MEVLAVVLGDRRDSLHRSRGLATSDAADAAASAIPCLSRTSTLRSEPSDMVPDASIAFDRDSHGSLAGSEHGSLGLGNYISLWASNRPAGMASPATTTTTPFATPTAPGTFPSPSPSPQRSLDQLGPGLGTMEHQISVRHTSVDQLGGFGVFSLLTPPASPAVMGFNPFAAGAPTGSSHHQMALSASKMLQTTAEEAGR